MLKESIIEPTTHHDELKSLQQTMKTQEEVSDRLFPDYPLIYTSWLPNISEMIIKIAHYRDFSTFDLQSAYRQVLLKYEDKPYTGFEARGNLCQFTWLPSGVTKGVVSFQSEK